MKLYHFDTLPVRPQPQPLESFCSYTIRLATANGFERLSQWWQLCYPSSRSCVTDHTGDFIAVSFGSLPELATCSEQTLWQTTFYHLTKKFGCAPNPDSMGNFMAGSVAEHLRYCPSCLVEHSYYRLTWRFLALPGCPQHSCEFRHSCGHCGQIIPLLPRRLNLKLCPHCGQDLSLCLSPELDEPTWQRAQARERDLIYLLTPQPFETSDDPLKKRLGEQFAHRRLSRHLKIVQVAHDLSYLVSTLQHLESPSKQTGGKLAVYMRYADYLNVNLQTLFESPPPQETYEDILANQVQQVIADLTQAGQWATKETLAQLSDLPINAFDYYPKLKALWSAFLAQRRQVRYTGLVNQIEQTAAQLEQEGQRVSVSRISRRMGRSNGDMSQYPRTSLAMKQVTGPAALARYQAQREEQLLQAVQKAITTLEDRGERVSKTAICREVGVCLATLEDRSRIKAFLVERIPVKSQEYLTRRRQQQDADLLTRVQQAVETLQATDEPVTLLAICQAVNKSEHGLRAHPSVDLFLKQVVQERLTQERQQRETELLALVQHGVETLRATGQPVTVRALCQMLDKGENSFRRYESIDTFLKQVVQERQTQTHQQREAELLLLVQQGVEILGADGQPVPIRALCQFLNKTETGLRRYTSIDAYLKQVIASNARIRAGN